MESEPKKRVITSTVEWITSAANALPADEVHAEAIRSVLNEMGLLRHQRGNQSIGDVLGNHGYGLPTHKHKGKNRYRLPEGGLTRQHTETVFVVPPGYAWQPPRAEEWMAAATKAMATATQQSERPTPTPKRPQPPRPASQTAVAAWAEIAETKCRLDQLREGLLSIFTNLMRVADLLAEAAVADPALTEAGAMLRTLGQSLAAAEDSANEIVLPPAD